MCDIPDKRNKIKHPKKYKPGYRKTKPKKIPKEHNPADPKHE